MPLGRARTISLARKIRFKPVHKFSANKRDAIHIIFCLLTGHGRTRWTFSRNPRNHTRLTLRRTLGESNVQGSMENYANKILIGVQISSCGFARDGVTTVSFHRSVFTSMRWRAVISRY